MSFIGQPAAAGITSAANIGIAEMTNKSNEKIAAENNALQLQMWHEQQQHDIDMWNMENEYNSPVNQVKRLQDANINPLAILGNSSNTTGAASGSPGGQIPPQLNTPQMIAPQLDPVALSQSFKNFQEGLKAKSEAGISSITEENYREAALKGFNPELYKAQVLLQTYNNMKKEGKYIAPYMEAQIKKFGAETDYTQAFKNVRIEEAKKIVEEAKGLEMTNRFNAEAFPQQIAQLIQNLKVQWEEHLANMNVLSSQEQLNRANAENASAQAGLASQSQKTEAMRTIQEGFKAGLSKAGINPNASNLPFFAGVALKLTTGELKPPQVTQFFKNLSLAEKVGFKGLANGRYDLTQFELQGKPNGFLGTGFNLPSAANYGDNILQKLFGQ